MENIKNKQIIIPAIMSLIFLGIIASLIGSGRLKNKLGTSVIDPTTNKECAETVESANIKHTDEKSLKDVLDELYAAKDSKCSTGYSCNKPPLPTQNPNNTCYNLSSNNINYNYSDQQMNVEDALKNLYAIYNSDGFCPQKYCKPNTYTITLDKNGGTSQGTAAIYEKYNTGVYLEEAATNAMTSSQNPITKPAKTYTVSYNANSQGATYTETPTSSEATFNGYYTAKTDGTQMISNTGYIVPSNFPNNKYTEDTTLYARWTNTSITLPAISKTDYTCKWAEGSATGTQYAGGTSRTISANTTYYAICTANPIILVKNMACDSNGKNCTQNGQTVTKVGTAGSSIPIAATAISGYATPKNETVTFGAANTTKTLTFYHTKNISLTYNIPFTSPKIRANHVSDHTDIHTRQGNSTFYLYLHAPTSGEGRVDSTVTASSNFKDLNNNNNTYIRVFPDNKKIGSGDYGNGVYGTYYVYLKDDYGTDGYTYQTGSTAGGQEELRPYIDIEYDLAGGTGTSSKQHKYVGETLTLHGTPSKSDSDASYAFKGWAVYNMSDQRCQQCYTRKSDGTYDTSCTNDSNYAASTSLNTQDLNVGNESFPCSSKETYYNGKVTIKLKAIWQKNAWAKFN